MIDGMSIVPVVKLLSKQIKPPGCAIDVGLVLAWNMLRYRMCLSAWWYNGLLYLELYRNPWEYTIEVKYITISGCTGLFGGYICWIYEILYYIYHAVMLTSWCRVGNKRLFVQSNVALVYWHHMALLAHNELKIVDNPEVNYNLDICHSKFW